MKKLSVIFLLILCSCSGNDEKKESVEQASSKKIALKKENQNPPAKKTTKTTIPSTYTFNTIGTSGNFGYQIFDASGKLVINQPNIPAVQGNKGFSSEKDAGTVAEFVIQKIDQGLFPPTLTVAELDSLKIVH